MQKLNILLLLVHLFMNSVAEGLLVVTKNGPIRGTTSLRDDVDAFLGIPFAEPPVGDLRFARPVPKKIWTETLDASRLPPACAQYPIMMEIPIYFMPSHVNNSEDCLYLNVWAPKSPSKGGSRPVFVYIHHGSFSHGSGIQFDGSNLASRADMVVVTINYRLGSMGFFLAHVEEANGNMGMYDQLLAIEWMRNNGESFGGDPENIIVSGASAGALSVGVHLVSPLTQKLFRKAYFQSGSIINPVYLDVNEKLFKNSELIASMAGCTNRSVTLKNDPHSVVKCLKAKPKDVILGADIMLAKSNPAVFYPRVGDEFLPKEATLLFREGKFRRDVDVMYGTGSNEGGLLLIGALHDYVGFDGKTPMETMTKRKMTLFGRFAAKLGRVENVSEIISFYVDAVKNETPSEYIKILSRAIGDYAVTCGTVFLADFLSLRGNRVYYYKLAFHASSTPLAEWVEATHLDDIQYIFANPYHENFTAEEVELSNRLIARISSFAKTGNPNIPEGVPWMQYSYDNPFYLNIGQKEESLRLKPYNRCEIWRSEFKCDVGPDLIRTLSEPDESHTNSGFSLLQEASFISLLFCLSLTVL